MRKNITISFFDNLISEPVNSLIQKAVDEGRVPIGYSCSLIPEPLLSLGKLFPVRLYAQGVNGTQIADNYLSSVLCSYSRSILERAIMNGFDFLGGVIFAASCDHIRRAGQHFELLGINKINPNFFSYLVDAPRKVSPIHVEWLAKDYRKLAGKLADNYGVDTSDSALFSAIKEHNNFTSLLKSIGDLRKNDQPPISGTEFHKLMVASKLTPKDLLLEPLKNYMDTLKEQVVLRKHRARIMVIGSECDNPAYTELIESQGALVVADRYCWGSLPGLEPIPEERDPYISLASHYLNMCACPRMMEKYQERVDQTITYYNEYKADGIILETMKFCDLWGYEILTMVEALHKADIPVVRVEREYPLTGQGQLRTRIQAFIESIEGRRDLQKVSMSILKRRGTGYDGNATA